MALREVAAGQNHRRSLRFHSIEEAEAELDRIVEADQAGRLRAMGNWTAGQILGHLAAWCDYAYDGYPMKPPPRIIRWFLRWQVQKYLRHGFPAGVRIPRVRGGTYGVEQGSTSEGADRLRRAWRRLDTGELARHHHPAFGPLSELDRVALNLRHAELHLGFLQYEPQDAQYDPNE